MPSKRASLVLLNINESTLKISAKDLRNPIRHASNLH